MTKCGPTGYSQTLLCELRIAVVISCLPKAPASRLTVGSRKLSRPRMLWNVSYRALCSKSTCVQINVSALVNSSNGQASWQAVHGCTPTMYISLRMALLCNCNAQLPSPVPRQAAGCSCQRVALAIFNSMFSLLLSSQWIQTHIFLSYPATPVTLNNYLYTEGIHPCQQHSRVRPPGV